MTWQTDKIANGYLPTYLRIAERLGPAADVLELGVDQGQSLEMWRDLFPHGRIVGVDNNPRCQTLVRMSPRISLVIAEQDAPDLPARLGLLAFDLIVDDASHLGRQTRASLKLLWPMLAPGGFYVVEDWGVGYPTGAPMHDPEMFEFATGLLQRFDPTHPDQPKRIIFEPGLIILEKLS